MTTPSSNIKNWSITPASNNATPPQGAPEGMAPSTVNDIMRQQMSDHRYQWQDAEWFCWGDTLSRASGTTFKVNGTDATSRYLAQRRIKLFDTTTMYGTVVSSSYSAPDTTVTISPDTGSLTNSFSQAALGILSPVNTSIPSTQAADDSYPCFGRLTLTTVTPVTTADVTAATTLYFTPYKGDALALYDGTSAWTIFNFTELSIAIPATNNTMYDVWVYNNAGVPTLEVLAWTNDTTRATALVKQNGVLVKSGATTRRYVGSFRTTGTVGQTEDSLAKRYVWNYYNRVIRSMKVVDGTDSWTYSTAAFQQANANAANQLDFVIGVSEDSVFAQSISQGKSSGVTLRNIRSGIGLDSTTVNSAVIQGWINVDTTAVGLWASSYFDAPIAVGRHILVWLERGGGADTQTFYGDNGGVGQTGIQGYLLG